MTNAASDPNAMNLYVLGHRWLSGQPLDADPEVPLHITIRPGQEHGTLPSLFEDPPVMTEALAQAFRDAGVENLRTFPVVLESKDQTVVHHGYVAYKILSDVRMDDFRSLFAPPTSGDDPRLIATAVAPQSDRPPDGSRIGALKLFRIEDWGFCMVVHEAIKQALETKGFSGIRFRAFD